MTAAKNPPLPPAKVPKKAPAAAASGATADDLGFNLAAALPWFPHAQEAPYVLIRVDDAHAQAWASVLGVAVRRCYITDGLLEERAQKMGRSKAEIVAAVLPDPGSTMAGDFGEILVYLYQAAKEQPTAAIGPKKWRLKQDRTKPAPYSDVVQFILPSWPQAGDRDAILCSEVKSKSGDSAREPITKAIADSAKDRTSRLAKTLVWLKERALIDDLSGVTIDKLERFINAVDYPPAQKRFRAVAVVCSSLVDGELATAPAQAPTECSVVVISVPELKKVYSSVFEAAHKSVPQPPAGKGRAK